MLLFRYFASHAFETLRDVRLKVAAISSFNDPFECMYCSVGEMTPQKARQYVRLRSRDLKFLDEVKIQFNCSRREAKRRLKSSQTQAIENLVKNFDSLKNENSAAREKLLDKILRVVCFSSSEADPHDEILMWSHYASSHRGVRLGFEFPNENGHPFDVVPVSYQDKRVDVDVSVLALKQRPVLDAVKLSMRTKSRSWAYEKEHRLITHPKRCITDADSKGGNLEFLPFKEAWVRRVDFGARYPIEKEAALLQLLRDKYPHVECYRAKYHAIDYALVYERIH